MPVAFCASLWLIARCVSESSQKLLKAEIAEKYRRAQRKAPLREKLLGMGLLFSAISAPALPSLRLRAFDSGASLENALRIDDYEDTAAAGEDGSLFVDDFSNTHEPPSTFADFARFNFQSLIQRHGPAIFDGHARRGSDDIAEFAQFAHGIVKNGRDDATVAVTGRSGVAFSESKVRDKMIPLLIQREFQMHAVRIILATGKAQVFLPRMRLSAVSAYRSFSGHK